jgi:hypothetical protein
MSDPKKPATVQDVIRTEATIRQNVRNLVKQLGDPDQAIADEACRALLRIGELAVGPLTDAILRPTSPIQRIMAIFCVRFIHPKDSLDAQKALIEVQRSEHDNRIVTLVDATLLELAMDGMENEANKARRRVTGSNPSSKIPPGSNTNLRVDSASSPRQTT